MSLLYLKKNCCGVPHGLGFGFALQMRGEVSSQSRKGNQTVCLVSEVAFEAINELEVSLSIGKCL